MNDRHLSDQDMDVALRAWMQEVPSGQADRSRVVGHVVGRLGSTRRPRRWRLSLHRSRAVTAVTPPAPDRQPNLIPATNGHAPTITGRTQIMFSPANAVVAGALIIGSALVIAQPFQQASTVPGAATEEGAAPQVGVLTTGRRIHQSVTEFQQESDTNNPLEQRGRITVVLSDMSDERLSGTATIVDNADRWFEDETDESFTGDLLWGTIEITNDGGAWTGTAVGTTDTSANGFGVTYYELTGSGGYEGLSAVVFEDEARGWLWNGVIFPGALPPDR